MTDTEAISLEAKAIRDSGALGRSKLLDRLFDYLTACTLEARSPKEAEVGAQVFGRSPDFDTGQDAVVRVYVHKLRRKLDAIYAGARKDEDARLNIPRGEYRLVLEPMTPEAAAPAARRFSLAWIIAAAAFIAALSSAITWLTMQAAAPAPVKEARALRSGPVWGPLLSDGMPTLVVLGDYYIFGESDDGMEPSRLVREFSVNSREDLDEYLMMHPEKADRYIDLDLRYLPVSAAYALHDVLPLLPFGAGPRAAKIVLASDVTPTMLKTNNIVYVGYFSGLGALRDAVFTGSRFQVGQTYDDIIDTRSKRRYFSEGGPAPAGQVYRDYGYVSTFKGPAGNRFIVVAGARDEGLMQAADEATTKATLDDAVNRAGGGDAFEALYEVQGLNRQNVGGKLLTSSPVDSAGKWREGPAQPQIFPSG